jgi:hypothetical protein
MKYLALLFMCALSTYILGSLIADMRVELRQVQGVLEEERARVHTLQQQQQESRELIRYIVTLIQP